MAKQWSTTLRTAVVEAIETVIGPTAVLRLRTGAPPANCAAPDTGTLVATFTFAADWSAPASAGVKVIVAGTAISANATSPGTLGHYRLYAADGTTCHDQGTVGATGSGADLIFDNPVIVSGQQLLVGPNWTIAAPHA